MAGKEKIGEKMSTYNNAFDNTESNVNNLIDYLTRANFYLISEKYEEAISVYDQVIKLNSNENSMFNCYGYFKGTKNHENELIKCNQSIELNPDNTIAYVYSNRSCCYAKLKKYKEALLDCNKAIELNSNEYHFYINRAEILFCLNQHIDAATDFDKVISLSEDKVNVSIFAKTAFVNAKQYNLAKKYIEKAFEDTDENQAGHRQAHLDDIRNREELDKSNKELEEKNKELELRNQELELQKKETEEAYQRVHEKEKEMLSFFTHTMRNALATAPTSLREAIRLLNSDDYKKNQKHYNAINKIVTLFSTLSLTDSLIDTFKQSINDRKEFTESWEKDDEGDATPKWVIALALRQSLNRIIFTDADQSKRLLNTQETNVLKATRKSFIDNVLPLDVNAHGVTEIYDWLGSTINLIEINMDDEDSSPRFGRHQVKFSLLFAITSELILNTLKYWNGSGKIQISWKFHEGHYIFTIRNGCNPNAISNLAGSKTGIKFITQLVSLLGEQAEFNCTQEENDFVVKLTLYKTLFEKQNKHELVMD